MSSLNTIDELLEVDERLTAVSKQWLDSWDPHLLESIHDASNLFDTVRRAFGQAVIDDEGKEALSTAARSVGVASIFGLTEQLYEGGRPRPDKLAIVAQVGPALDRAWSRRVRAMLLMLCHRSLLWAATDFMRRRLTPSLGELRFQVESAALALAVRDDPHLALEWVFTKTFSAGRSFYGKTHKRVLKILDAHSLRFAWDAASAFAEHVRFAGLVGSVSFDGVERDGRDVSEISIGFHEGAELDDSAVLVRVLLLLRTQDRVLRLCLEALPEVTDPITLQARIPRFTAQVNDLFTRFERDHPHIAENARRLGNPWAR